MNLALQTSLQWMTEVKIVSELCKQAAIRNAIEDPYLTKENQCLPFHEKIKVVESEVTKSVEQLQLPVPLKNNLSCVIRPIVHQIIDWWNYHCSVWRWGLPDEFRWRLPDEFRWTPAGTIDWKSTAQTLMQDESLDLNSRQALARDNCLDEWALSEEYFKESRHRVARYHRFHSAIFDMNLAATKFYFDELSHHEKSTYPVLCAISGLENVEPITFRQEQNFAQILYFLLLKMSQDERDKVFKKRPYRSLLCFLTWPLQPLFLDIAERYARLIEDERQCMWLVEAILVRVDRKEFDYRYLLRNFVPLIPKSHRKWVAKNLIFSKWNRFLFEDGNEDVLKKLIDAIEEKDEFV